MFLGVPENYVVACTDSMEEDENKQWVTHLWRMLLLMKAKNDAYED